MILGDRIAYEAMARAIVRCAIRQKGHKLQEIEAKEVRKAARELLNDPLEGRRIIDDVKELLAKHMKK